MHQRNFDIEICSGKKKQVMSNQLYFYSTLKSLGINQKQEYEHIIHLK